MPTEDDTFDVLRRVPFDEIIRRQSDPDDMKFGDGELQLMGWSSDAFQQAWYEWVETRK